jgi:hypothetical protein
VDALQGHGDAQGGMAVSVEKRCRLHDQKRSQPLASIQHPMPHRSKQTSGSADLSRKDVLVEQAAQRGLDGVRA